MKNDYRKVGYFGIFYSMISIFFYLLITYQGGNLYIFSLITNVLFFIFVILFLKNLDYYPLESFPKNKKEKSYLLSLLGHLIFIITITNFIFIGTIGIHEFGHFSISKFYDCDYRKIVYEGDLFHTEILCSNLPSNSGVILGGILAPFIIALILFLIGGKLVDEIAMLIVSFNFLAISRDLNELGISNNISFIAIFLGIIGLIYGLFKLVKSRTDEDFYLSDLDSISTKKKIGTKQKKSGRYDIIL